jgi:hypothetical protein
MHIMGRTIERGKFPHFSRGKYLQFGLPACNPAAVLETLFSVIAWKSYEPEV